MQQIYTALCVHFVTSKERRATLLGAKYYLLKRLAVARWQVWRDQLIVAKCWYLCFLFRGLSVEISVQLSDILCNS
jgi:hypothetical protein